MGSRGDPFDFNDIYSKLGADGLVHKPMKAQDAVKKPIPQSTGKCMAPITYRRVRKKNGLFCFVRMAGQRTSGSGMSPGPAGHGVGEAPCSEINHDVFHLQVTWLSLLDACNHVYSSST